MTTWNLVAFSKAGEVYQEVDDAGSVRRYVNNRGVELFVEAPIGESCRVVVANAPPTAMMVAVEEQRAAARLAIATALRSEQTTQLKTAIVNIVDTCRSRLEDRLDPELEEQLDNARRLGSQ